MVHLLSVLEHGNPLQRTMWLLDLRSHTSQAWSNVWRGEVSEAEQKILEQADYFSLIEEHRETEDFSTRTENVKDIESAIRSYSDLLHHHIFDHRVNSDSLRGVGAHFRVALFDLLDDADANKKMPASMRVNESIRILQDNFFKIVLHKQLRYLSRHCPLAVAACTKLLDLAIGFPEQDTESYWKLSLERWHSGLYGARDVEQYIDSIYLLVNKMDTAEAKRLYALPNDFPLRSESGTNFMVTAEEVVLKALNAFGPPRYLQLAQSHTKISPWLRKGYFFEGYHVTKRFVEIITPMLAHHLNPTVRSRMYKYYAEEIGHEIF